MIELNQDEITKFLKMWEHPRINRIFTQPVSSWMITAIDPWYREDNFIVVGFTVRGSVAGVLQPIRLLFSTTTAKEVLAGVHNIEEKRDLMFGMVDKLLTAKNDTQTFFILPDVLDSRPLYNPNGNEVVIDEWSIQDWREPLMVIKNALVDYPRVTYVEFYYANQSDIKEDAASAVSLFVYARTSDDKEEGLQMHIPYESYSNAITVDHIIENMKGRVDAL